MESNHYYEKKIQEKEVYNGNITTYILREVELKNGERTWRELVLHDDSVSILALLDLQRALFVSQYRVAIDKVTWELPAGIIESGEDALFSAQRELLEETGYQANRWTKLYSGWSSPGFTNEKSTLYLAQDVRLESEKLDLDDTEDLGSSILSYGQVKKMVDQGEIDDLVTIMGYQAWRELRLRKNLEV